MTRGHGSGYSTATPSQKRQLEEQLDGLSCVIRAGRIKDAGKRQALLEEAIVHLRRANVLLVREAYRTDQQDILEPDNISLAQAFVFEGFRCAEQAIVDLVEHRRPSVVVRAWIDEGTPRAELVEAV